MRILKIFCMAFSTYSRIPMPQVKWEEKNADYVICFYPLVGLVVGISEAAWLKVAWMKEISFVVTALIMIAIPILLTGGIHLDGLIDTADARHSYLPKEEKLRILKDPHVGAFGVIRLLLYLILVLAGLQLVTGRTAADALTERSSARLSVTVFTVLIPFWSRIMCAYTSVWFPKAKRDGMLQSVTGGKRKIQTAILSVWAVLCVAIPFLLLPYPMEWARLAILIVADLVLIAWYHRMAIKEFGGVTGDLAGWLLCMLEAVGVMILVII